MHLQAHVGMKTARPGVKTTVHNNKRPINEVITQRLTKMRVSVQFAIVVIAICK